MRMSGRFEVPRVLGVEAARCIGISRGQVRTEIARGNWQRLARGIVLTRPDEPTRSDWAHVGLCLAGRTGALSGWDAVRSYGLGSRAAPSRPVLVLTRDGHNRGFGGVLVRQTARPYTCSTLPAEHPTLAFAPVVSAARAVADTVLGMRELGAARALLAQAVQRGRVPYEALQAEYDAGPRNGSVLLRRAIEDIRIGARSAAEAEVAGQLAANRRVPPFELNVPVVDPRGRVLFYVDVLWRTLRAGLEVDSRRYHYDAVKDWEATDVRHNSLTQFGLALTHYPPRVIHEMGASFAAEVAVWLAARARELGVGLPPGHGVIPPGPSGATPYVV